MLGWGAPLLGSCPLWWRARTSIMGLGVMGLGAQPTAPLAGSLRSPVSLMVHSVLLAEKETPLPVSLETSGTSLSCRCWAKKTMQEG